MRASMSSTVVSYIVQGLLRMPRAVAVSLGMRMASTCRSPVPCTSSSPSPPSITTATFQVHAGICTLPSPLSVAGLAVYSPPATT